MKYHITIYRTLTYEADIEAEDENEANDFTEGLEAVLDDHAFDLETTWETKRLTPLEGANQ